MHTANHRTPLKGNEQDTDKRKDHPTLLTPGWATVRYRCYTKRPTGSTRTYQHHNSMFCINRKIHPKIHMGSQGNPNSQSWKRTKVKFPHFLISKHSYSNQNSVVGTSKKRDKCISGSNREPRNKLSCTWSQDLHTRVLRPLYRERTVSSAYGAGKTGHPCAKELIWTFILYHGQKLTHNEYQNVKTSNCKTPIRKYYREKLHDTGLGNAFSKWYQKHRQQGKNK